MRHWPWWAAAAVAALSVLALAAYALVATVAWLLDHAATIGGVVLLIALALALLARATGGRSGHCSGPNSGH